VSLGLQHCLKQEIEPTNDVNGLGFLNCTSKPELGSSMGQEKSLQMGLNGLGPLNICLKLKIGPTVGQREESQQMA
jgi:hypothetical protein